MRWKIVWFGHKCSKESPLSGVHILFTQLIEHIFVSYLLDTRHLLTQAYGSQRRDRIPGVHSFAAALEQDL